MDEPKKVGFKHGTVSFAGAGPDSRSCHIFIAMAPDGERLGNADHETPFGELVDGIEVLQKLQESAQRSGYGDLSELQTQLIERGNAAAKHYPKLDRINSCKVTGGFPSGDPNDIRVKQEV